MRSTADRERARHGHPASVADAHLPYSDPTFGSCFCSAAHKSHLRRCTRGAMDENIGKRHASPEPRSHSFQDSFLRGKPARQALNPAGPVAHLVEFFLNEAARDQRITRILYPASHFGDVDQINPMSDDVHIRRQSLPSRPQVVTPRNAPRIVTMRCHSRGDSRPAMNILKDGEYAMTNTDGMFWSGETLSERLAALIEPFAPERVDCAAYTLSVGPEVYVSPNSQTADPTTVTVRKLAPGDAFTIPPGQFAFLLTEEIVAVPANALAFISIRAKTKFRGLVNVSGFHVDPGYRGQLTFAVFNAGPVPIHLKRGQPIFLIWYASLDRETAFKKDGHVHMGIDTELIAGVAGELQSFSSLSTKIKDVDKALGDRIHAVEKEQTYCRVIGAIVLTIVISVAVVWLKDIVVPPPATTMIVPQADITSQSTPTR